MLSLNLHYFKKCWRLSIQIEILCIFKSATLFSPLDSEVKLWGPILTWQLCEEQVAMGQRMRVSEAGTRLLSLPSHHCAGTLWFIIKYSVNWYKKTTRVACNAHICDFSIFIFPLQGGNVKGHSETARPLCAWRCWSLFYYLCLSRFPLLSLEVFYFHENRKESQKMAAKWWR